VIWNGASKDILDPFSKQIGTEAKTGY